MPTKIALLVFFVASIASAQAPSFPACDSTQTLLQYRVCEVVIPQSTYVDPDGDFKAYTIPDVKAVFSHKNGSGVVDRLVTVHAFYERDASNLIVFKIRFNMTDAGDWSYAIDCREQAPPNAPCGVTGPSKSFTVNASSEKGFLRRDAALHTKFIYDNGSHPFIWGQTYYQLISSAVSGNNWKTAVTNSNARGLNKIRMLLYPWWDFFTAAETNNHYADTQPFVGGKNTPDHNRLNLNHWRKFDEVVNYLYNTTDTEGSRMLAEIILFKDPASGGVNGDNSPINDMNRTFAADPALDDRYIRYAVARFGAFPNVMWCFSNEWQFTGKDAAYWNNRATTLLGWDPWMFDAAGTQQRATSIHGQNDRRFSFAGSTWPAHDVMQFSLGHPVCVPGGVNPCPNSDEWANFSIVNNLVDNRPVVNDESGYLNAGLGDLPDRCLAGTFSADNARRAMWGIAVGGGYGTFGDATGPCSPTKRTSISIRSDWEEQNNQVQAYKETLALAKFFKTTLNGVWWKMNANNARVSKFNNATRAYAMEGGGQILAYAVRNESSNQPGGRFNVNLPVDRPVITYTTTYYDPRGVLTCTQNNNLCPKQKRVTCPKGRNCATNPFEAPTRFVTPTVDDWALRVVAPSPPPPGLKNLADDDFVWVADDVPAGAAVGGDSESWNWIDDAPTPISDSLAHQSSQVAGMHQHYFSGASEPLMVSAGNMLFAYVYLDPSSSPTEVMLQWNDGTWEHRAYWGANQINWGTDGTNSRRYAGPLPAPGEWVRLQVSAGAVGLEGKAVNGMAFTLFGGKASWDDAGRAGQFVPVCEPGVIVQQPQSQTIIPGDSATMTVAVTGTGPFNYQYYQAPVGVYQNPTGISTATINTGPLTATKQYWAEINDTCMGGFLASDLAVITVQCTAAPAITVQPASRVTTPGQSTTLGVSATQAVSFQWYQGNSPSTATPVSGATFPTLTVSPQSTTNYWARVSNGCGFADSVTATVCVLPAITAQPTPRTINPGQSTTLTVSAINAATYQWYVGNASSTATPIGGNSSSLTVSPGATTSYWVRVSNSCGLVDSTTVTVTVAPPPPLQITRMQSAVTLANSQNSVTATWPQPTQPGTFLVAVISGLKDPAQLNWTAPAGWQLATVEEWPNVKLAIYYLPNNAGARTSETFTVAQGYHDMTLYILEYSGVVAVSPLDRVGSTGDFTNNGYVQTGFTANTVQPKELVITGLSTYAQTEFTVAPVDGYAEVYDRSVLYHLTTAMYERVTTSIGSYGHGATVYVPAEWVGVVATFRAAN